MTKFGVCKLQARNALKAEKCFCENKGLAPKGPVNASKSLFHRAATAQNFTAWHSSSTNVQNTHEKERRIKFPLMHKWLIRSFYFL